MILKVFAIHDHKAEAFLQPFFSNSIGNALRAFGDAVNDEKYPFYKHPEDYSVYEIGSYDDSVALLDALVPVKMLALATDFVNKEKADFSKIMSPDKKVAMKELEFIENGKKQA